MTRGNLKILARAYIPGAKTSVIVDDVLNIILDNAVNDIAGYTCCLKTNKKFNVVASTGEYNLSVVIGNYLAVDKSGLWWYDATQWKKLNPRTLKWFDDNRPNWRDLSADSPQEYSIDGDVLTVVPKPVTAVTEGFWLYYGRKAPPMTQDSHYPFSGSTTPFTHLEVFDEVLLAFARWKIEPMLNKDGEDLTEAAYLRLREEKFNIFKTRRDISADKRAAFMGPRVR